MPLTEDQIKALYPAKKKFDTSRRVVSPDFRTVGEDWMSPLNKIIWQEAFRNKRGSVKLRDGRVFKCRYVKNEGRNVLVDPNETLVRVKPELGFVPCGTFVLSEVTHKQWITEDDTKVRTL